MDRILKVYGDYFWDFFNKIPKNVKVKIEYVFEIIISVDRIPKKFFKNIEDGIYEIRIERNSNIYRIFSFFDDRNQVVLLHGIQKKSQKLPRREIDKPKKLRKMYYDEKEKSKHNK